MAYVAYQMHCLPTDLLAMDDDGFWLGMLIEVHNDNHPDNGEPLT